MPHGPRTIVWAEAGQEPLVRAVVDGAGLELVAIGSPTATAAVQLCEMFHVERISDLRQTIAKASDIDLLWLAAPQRIDADLRRMIRDRSLRAVTTEPRPIDIAEAISDPLEADTATFVPLMRRGPGYRAASQVIADLGPVRQLTIAMRSGPGEGSLFARLFDAMDVVNTLCGQASALEASYAGPLSAVPNTLAGLHGHVTLNVRFTGNCCSTISVSDTTGPWFRGVTVFGEHGVLRMTDSVFEFIGPDGKVVDRHDEGTALGAADLVGHQIGRLLGHKDSTEVPPENARLLALCEAARLSCRTGQGEAPRKMLEMMRRP